MKHNAQLLCRATDSWKVEQSSIVGTEVGAHELMPLRPLPLSA